jgi:hypothetical protein
MVTTSKYITNLITTVVAKGTTDDPFCNSGYSFTCPKVGATIKNIKMQCMFTVDFWY